MPEEIPTQPEETKTVTEVVSEIEKSPEVQVPVKSKPWLKPLLFSILGIVFASGLVFAGYKLGQRSIYPKPVEGPTPTPVVVATPTPDPTTGWKTYTNDFAKFSLKYPPSMTVTEKVLSAEEKQIVFTGPEGTITINAAVPESSGWGGGCDPEDQREINFLGKPTKICGGITGINQLYGTHPEGYSKIQIGAIFAEPYAENKEIVLSILSTFKFLEEKESVGEKVFCQDPRPEVCTMECITNPPYICGSDGKSYCNVCGACADPEVEWYIVQDTPCKP